MALAHVCVYVCLFALPSWTYARRETRPPVPHARVLSRQVAENGVLPCLQPGGGGGATAGIAAVGRPLAVLRPPPLLLAVRPRLLLSAACSRGDARGPPLGAPLGHVLLRDVHVHRARVVSLSLSRAACSALLLFSSLVAVGVTKSGSVGVCSMWRGRDLWGAGRPPNRWARPRFGFSGLRARSPNQPRRAPLPRPPILRAVAAGFRQMRGEDRTWGLFRNGSGSRFAWDVTCVSETPRRTDTSPVLACQVLCESSREPWAQVAARRQQRTGRACVTLSKTFLCLVRLLFGPARG